MPVPRLCSIMINIMNRLSRTVIAAVLLLVAGEIHAGIVVGGTRFVFPAGKESISILLTNTSQEPWLVNSKINSPTHWAGGINSPVQVPVLVTPPLFLLQPGTAGTLRLLKMDSGNLPTDRETLYELNIASVPSGKVENQSVKVAMRSVFKLFWRPAGLTGDPLESYQQLGLTLTSKGVQLRNPTPYYINLVQVTVNGKTVSDAGVVAPKSERQTTWCKAMKQCQLTWRAINDFGGMSAIKTQILTP